MIKYVKRITTLGVFFIGLIGLLMFFSEVYMPKNNMADEGMEEVEANGILGERQNSIDVLIIGDSESYTSMIPLQIWKETGITSYICGTSGQTLDYANTILKRALTKQSPKMVILETNEIYRKQTRTNVMYTKLCNQISLFRYHNRWKTLDWRDVTKTAEFTWSDENKGFRLSTTVSPSTKKEYMILTENKAKIPEINRSCVEEIKKLCDDNGAILVLVSTPSSYNWNYENHNGIAELASELDCTYVDMNLLTEEIPIDWDTDTRDKGDHLNYYGAKKVTAYLSEYLKKNEQLKSHKGDNDYKSWDELLERFEKTIS